MQDPNFKMKLKINNKLFIFFLSLLIPITIFLRIGLVNFDYFFNNLWAEDGLFIVCNLKQSPLNCLMDSYSGYLNIYARFISLFVSFFPIQFWAFANNAIYLFNSWIIAVLVITILKYTLGIFRALILTLVPYLIPIYSVQVIGVNSSFYLILIYYSIILTIFLNVEDYSINKKMRKFKILIYILALFSNPLSIVILMVIFFKNITKLNSVFYEVVAIAIFSIPQVFTVYVNGGDRFYVQNYILILQITLNYLIKTFISTFYLKPDILLLDPIFGQAKLVEFIYKYIFILSIFGIILSLLFLFSKQYYLTRLKPIFLLFIAIFITLLISAFTNGWPERFLVLTSGLFLSSLIYFLSEFGKNVFKFFTTTLIFILLFFPLKDNFYISNYRSSGPLWSNELVNLQNSCKSEKNVAMEFSPFWPTQNTHEYGLKEPTTNLISCNLLFKSTKN